MLKLKGGTDTVVNIFVPHFLFASRVSSDATISGDEEDDKIKSSFDSFIDDRVSASATSTQDETGGHDMMAIYRFL